MLGFSKTRKVVAMSDSSPTLSTKSTTPTMNNRGDFVDEPKEQIPQAAHQPNLDTVNQTAEPWLNLAPEKAVDRQQFIQDRGAMNETWGAAPQSDGRTRSHRGSRRRTHSDGHAIRQMAYYGGGYPHPSHPGSYHPVRPYPPQTVSSSIPSLGVNSGPPPRGAGAAPRGPRHHRVRSWQAPTDIPPYSMMAYGPPQNISPTGRSLPYHPVETGPLLPYTSLTSNGSHRKRRDQQARSPVTSQMAMPPGEISGMYGSFDDRSYEELSPPPPPLNAPPQYGPRQDHFSPRTEVMKLATGAGFPSPSTPSQRKGSPGYARTPRISPSSLRGAGTYATQHMSFRGDDAAYVTFSPGTPQYDGYGQSARGGYNFISDFSGNADLAELSYADMRRGGRSKHHSLHRSPHSKRKMHMRQLSAELFMADTKGVKQPIACRDFLFFLLFLLHLAGIFYLGTTYNGDAFMENKSGQEATVNIWYRKVIFVAALCGAFAVALSTLTLLLMTMIVRRLVQVSLVLTIMLSFAWGTIGIGVSPKNVVPITGFIALALSVGYAFVVWDRIPFASANLLAGLTGVRKNAGTILVALFFQFLALVWSIYFTFVLFGVYDALLTGDLKLTQRATVFVYTMLVVSYFWTYNVLLNVVHVTVAGTIGSWWFKPDSQSSFCDSSVTSTFLQAMTSSFGSICFGSLLVEPVRLIRQLSAFFRPTDEEFSLMCLHECVSWIQRCISSCVDNLADYFNLWAFAYIGLYRYGFLESGHNAMSLFKKRGWTSIVSDDLIHNVLFMVSLVIGGVTGCFGVLTQQMDHLNFSTFESPTFFAFGIGFYTGLVVTSVLFGIISSSVNAVIVLFAGSPVDLEKNHPEISEELRSAWREVWPGCMDDIDLQIDSMKMVNPQGATDIPIV